MKLSRNQLILFGILGLLLLTIPFTLYILQTSHETRSRASNETPLPAVTCGSQPTDIILLMDASDSMSATIDTSGNTKIKAAKAAAINFVNIISANTANRVGLVSFATTSTLNSPLTSNFSAVKTAINGITLSKNTCTQCGIDAANAEIKKDGRTGITPIIILLTDGRANFIEGWPSTHGDDIATGQTAATTATQTDYNQTHFTMYTIGLGTDVSTSFLQNLAKITNGAYYFSPDTTQLNSIYTTISSIIGKGTITGSLFNDLNNNGASDSGEPSLPGWIVDLKVGSPSGTAITKATTDGAGSYIFNDLCDGTYYVTQELQSGWSQTFPATPTTYYSPIISKGNTIPKQDFGDLKRACGTACTSNVSCAGASNSCTTCTNNTCQINYCGKTCTTNADCGSQSTSQCGVCDINSTHTCVTALSPTATFTPSPKPTATPTIKPTPTASSTLTPTQINYCGKTCNSNSDCQGNGSACQFCDVNGTHKCVADITPTATPANMSVALDVLMHNIGSSGDNASTLSALSNKNPLHPDRNAHVFVYDTNNQQVADAMGTISYSTASGSFKGVVDLGTSLATGTYYVKIQSDYHLRRLVPGILSLTAGTTNQTPQINLVAGDADNDNALTLLDYNMLIGCYSVLEPAKACQTGWKDATDFNDDGNVDSTDYNLFLRELSVQQGE